MVISTFFNRSLLTLSLTALALTLHGQGMRNLGAKVTVSGSAFLVVNNGAFTNDGATALLTNNGTVDVSGTNANFTNTAGAAVTNSGTMEVEGNWTNNSANNVFGATPTAATGGTVILDGAAQNIAGSVPTHFWDLRVDGGPPATAIKTLQVGASVYNQIHIENVERRVMLNTNTLTLVNSAANAITGAGRIQAETTPAAGYGRVRWNIGNYSGLYPVTYTVPFRTAANVSIPVVYTVHNPGVGGTANPFKDFSTYPTTPDNLPVPIIPSAPGVNVHVTNQQSSPNHHMVADRFWLVDDDLQGNYSYDFDASINNYPHIELTLTYDPADILGPNTITEANLVAQRFNHLTTVNNPPTGGTWGDWLFSPTANTANKTVTVNLTRIEDFFPIWTLADNSDPLPIELARFVAQCDNGGVSVSWTTYTETDNDYFTLERSKNGVDFEMVDVIEGAGNSNSPITYQVLDQQSFGGTSYYRLKNTDFYGKEEYSQVIAVTCGEELTDFTFVKAYEIDNTDLMVEFTASQNEPYTITLFDVSGRLILNHGNKAFDGMNKVRLPVGDIAHGIYIINLQNETRRFSRKVLMK